MAIPSNLTEREYTNYYLSNDTKDNIQDRYSNLVDKYEKAVAYETELDKYYESAMEQSNFRRDVLEMIKELVEDKVSSARYKETKELAKDIILIIENSYVEL